MLMFSADTGLDSSEIRRTGMQGRLALSQRPERRSQLAASLGSAFARNLLSERERALAIEIFNCLARDTENEVRRSLAEQVKSSRLLPRSLARILAEDVETVAVPVLQNSPVLTDDDLVAIINRCDAAKLRAIAGRRELSERVSGALVESEERGAVAILLANQGAAISQRSYEDLLRSFGDDAAIQHLLVERPILPLEIKERLVWLVSQALRDRLVAKHDLPATLADQLSLHGREQVLTRSLAALHCTEEIEAAARRLFRKGALTSTLLLRTLADGQLEFFGAGMAMLADAPTAKVQNALRKAGTAVLGRLYARAGLPAQMQAAFQVVLELALERRRSGHTTTQPEDERRIVAELVRAYRQLSPDGLESVIYQLGRLGDDDPNRLPI